LRSAKLYRPAISNAPQLLPESEKGLAGRTVVHAPFAVL
jgi:hypothetical protein